MVIPHLPLLITEYLLKQYLQTSKAESLYRTMYDHAMNGVKRHLVGYSYPSHFTFIGELPTGVATSGLSPKMDHLVCFLGGNLALGATEGKTLEQARKKGWTIRQQEDLDLAEALTQSCVEMYNITATGLAPEIVRFNTDISKNEDITIKPNDRYDTSLVRLTR
jgi:endoplasmic reticulum Man9GlcNAc2 1,2-alpha-mannosidase